MGNEKKTLANIAPIWWGCGQIDDPLTWKEMAKRLADAAAKKGADIAYGDGTKNLDDESSDSREVKE